MMMHLCVSLQIFMPDALDLFVSPPCNVSTLYKKIKIQVQTTNKSAALFLDK